MTWLELTPMFEAQIPPAAMCTAPLPEQIDFLDPLLHAAEPDAEEFVNRLCIENCADL